MRRSSPACRVGQRRVVLFAHPGACPILFSLLVLLTTGCSQEQSPPSSPIAKESTPDQNRAAPAISEQAFRDAALQGSVATVQQAIAQGVKLDAPDADGRTALQLAAFDGHTDVVRLLLEQGPALDQRDGAGRTALMYAASGPNRETVSVLLEAGADPNVVDEVERFTALMFAAAEGQLEVVQALLKHGADRTLRDVDGDTARDFASQNGHHEVAQLLSE